MPSATEKQRDPTSYAYRSWILKKMGFSSYQAYLESDLWARIRKRVIQEKGEECVLCDKPFYAMHHCRYWLEDLDGTTTDEIHPLCDPCHYAVEFTDGKKNTVMEAYAAFNRMMAERGGMIKPKWWVKPIAKTTGQKSTCPSYPKYEQRYELVRPEWNQFDAFGCRPLEFREYFGGW